RVLIYYAGHGHTVELTGERQMGYLVPADAPDPSRDRLAFRRQALSMQEIEVFAKEIIAKHALFMFDACFAGSVFEAVRAAPKHIQRRTREPVRYFITSGSANQEVPDNSIFRQAFLEALRGDVDSDRDGYFTGSELGDYIYRRTVESIPNLDPQYGKLQDRNLNRGDFVFEIRQPRQALANAPTSSRDIAAQAWGMIEQSEDPAIFRAFIDKFPDAPQRQLAELKLMMLPSAPVEPKEKSLPEPKPSGTINLYDSKTDSTGSSSSGSNGRYSWTVGTVEDSLRKLIWQRREAGDKIFEEAQRYCENLTLSEKDDW
ncbi:MAG: caspase family protein, partial [Deltaproteobacteria bacterium]